MSQVPSCPLLQMASGGENSKFLSPGSCSIPDCEVTLLLEGETRLYACKHNLMDKCGFFKGLFSSDFKEKNSNEVRIQEVSHQDMLLFLECEFGRKPLPLDGDSLCVLISLADRFICPSLQPRLNEHLGTESMFTNLPLNAKLALIRTADKHKGNLSLLETCIRLCANLSFMNVSVLNGHISDGVMVAVFSIVVEATKHMETPPEHFCRYSRPIGQAFTKKLYDGSSVVEIGSKQVDAWLCTRCNKTEVKKTFTLTYEEVKQFKIDQSKLKE